MINDTTLYYNESFFI